MKRLHNFIKQSAVEFKKHKVIYSLLLIILTAAFFVRIYNLDKFLGFWFDQGRDALVIWDFWKNGKLFLIGPSTGIMGIFRGPWYYWLIAPAYILGGGDPLWPAVFLCFLTVIGIIVVYKLGVEIEGSATGLFAAAISAFSFNLVVAARWLANPTPMLLIGPLVALTLIRAAKIGKWWWPASAFLMGMAMQFGRATDIFYVASFILAAVFFRKKTNKNYLLLSATAFIIPFIPLVLFDLRHNGIVSTAYRSFFLEEVGFKLAFWEVVKLRLPLYWSVFSSKLFADQKTLGAVLLLIWVGILVANWKKFWQNEGFRILVILFVSPFVGLLFFQGKGSPVYDYYFTGYYLIFIVLVSRVLAFIKSYPWGLVFLVIFGLVFFLVNGLAIRNHLVSGPTAITIADEKKTLDWIYEDAGEQSFNVDVYVPPVIAYAYDYLFKWYPTTPALRGALGKLTEEKVPLLYTIYEADSGRPQFLDAWLKRQKGIGKVEKETTFGAITVQRRMRL